MKWNILVWYCLQIYDVYTLGVAKPLQQWVDSLFICMKGTLLFVSLSIVTVLRLGVTLTR